MSLPTRVKRAVKELLGTRQWRKPDRPEPRSFEEQIYAALIRPEDVCYDVGANQGEVALFLSRLVGETGMVVAFEPVWPMYARLCAVVQGDDYLRSVVVTIPAGLADSERSATIQVPDGGFELGSIADSHEWSKTQSGSALTSYDVRLLSLDGFLVSTQLPSPTFMKIDVEGAEWFVLQGAARTFDAGVRPLLLIEVFAPWEAAFGYQPWQPLSWLLERGYSLLFACPNGLVDYRPTALAPFPPGYEWGYNILAYVPSLHADRVAALDPLRAGSDAPRLPMNPPPRANHVV